MTNNGVEPRFGVDLITFYHPAFWSLESFAELEARAAAEPKSFWERIFKEVQAAGIWGIELTFGPGSWMNAVKTYGSAKNVQAAAGEYGLQVVSTFFADFERLGHVPNREEEQELARQAVETARFIRECGGDVLVAGLPKRPCYLEEPQPYGLGEAHALADALNRVGKATLNEGVKLALHTEFSSVFCIDRDVDLLLLLTDPEYVGFCPDTAHMVLGSGNPVEITRKHLDRVLITHWKDATGPFDLPVDDDFHSHDDAYFRRVGAGVVDWAAWTALFKGSSFAGCHLLEIDSVENPSVEIAEARRVAASFLS